MFSTRTSDRGGGVKGAIGGVLAGITLLVVATGVLFWNEGRSVKRAAVLEQGRSIVESVDAATPSSANEGRLVHVRGQLATGGVLQDTDFGVETDGLALRRRVEMFQWEEKRSGKSSDNGGEKVRYETTWEDRVIDHSKFKEPQGHENPVSLPFQAQRWQADHVRLGGFEASSEVVNELSDWQGLAPTLETLPPNLAASLRVEAGVLTSSESLNSPRVGDVRIRFDYVPLGAASVIAAQENGRLVEFEAKRGSLLLAERGAVSSDAMFDQAEASNTGLGWALRVGGFMAFWTAFGLMLRPVSGLLGRIPVLGSIGRLVTTAVSFLLALSLSLLTIVSGWLFYRPWLLVLILLAIAAAVFWLIKRAKRSPQPAPVAGSMPPPPGPPPPPPPN